MSKTGKLVVSISIGLSVFAIIYVVIIKSQLARNQAAQEQLTSEGLQLKSIVDSLNYVIEPFSNAIHNRIATDGGNVLSQNEIGSFEHFQTYRDYAPFNKDSVERRSDSRYRLSVNQAFDWPFVINIYADSITLHYFEYDTSNQQIVAIDISKYSAKIDSSTKYQINHLVEVSNFWYSSFYQDNHNYTDGYQVLVEGVSDKGYNVVVYGAPYGSHGIYQLIKLAMKEVGYSSFLWQRD